MTPSTEYDSNTSASSTGSRPRRRRRLWLSIAAAVVVVVIGAAYLTLRETVWAGPPTSGLTTQWKDQRPGAVEGCLGSSSPWINGRLVAQCSGTGIAALRISTGRVAWTWHPSGPHEAASVQQLSIGTDSGIGVVEYTYGESDEHMAGIDVATGRQLWTFTSEDADYNPIWVGQGRVAVATDSGKDKTGRRVVDVRDLATGKRDWSSIAPGRITAQCGTNLDAIAGPWIYTAAPCSGHADQLYQRSLKTGKVIAHAPLPDRSCETASDTPTLSAVPGYVLLGCGDSRPVVITAGTVRERPLSWPGNPPNMGFPTISDLSQQDAVASGNSLYLGQDITGENANAKDRYEIAAVDLRTSRVRWDKTITTHAPPEDDTEGTVNLLGADSHGVFAEIEAFTGYHRNAESIGMTLATLSASDGELSYGPGTTYDVGAVSGLADPQPSEPYYDLAGHVLLSFSPCGEVCTDGPMSYGPVIGYNTGTWPRSWTTLDRVKAAARRAVGGGMTRTNVVHAVRKR